MYSTFNTHVQEHKKVSRIPALAVKETPGFHMLLNSAVQYISESTTGGLSYAIIASKSFSLPHTLLYLATLCSNRP